MRDNDARGWVAGAITNDVLKFRKFIEFESSYIETCFSSFYLTIDGKRSFKLCSDERQNAIKLCKTKTK